MQASVLLADEGSILRTSSSLTKLVEGNTWYCASVYNTGGLMCVDSECSTLRRVGS